jgi:hypothetical protein
MCVIRRSIWLVLPAWQWVTGKGHFLLFNLSEHLGRSIFIRPIFQTSMNDDVLPWICFQEWIKHALDCYYCSIITVFIPSRRHPAGSLQVVAVVPETYLFPTRGRDRQGIDHSNRSVCGQKWWRTSWLQKMRAKGKAHIPSKFSWIQTHTRYCRNHHR